MKRILVTVMALIISIAFSGSALLAVNDAAASEKGKTKSESAGKYIDDSVITTKVKALLAKDELLKSLKISVKTTEGVVQLNGAVGSEQTREKAAEIAGGVEGVKLVKNNLTVKK